MVELEPLDPADREARLVAELQSVRAQAQAAAKLVLDLNGRVKLARQREQQFQQTIAALQSALQSSNQALSHAQAAVQAHQAEQLDAKAGIQKLSVQLLAARIEIQRLSKVLEGQRSSAAAAGGERDALSEHVRQMQGEQEVLQQQLATLSAALRASQQESLEAEARLERQSREITELRTELQSALDATRRHPVEAEEANTAALQSARSDSESVDKPARPDFVTAVDTPAGAGGSPSPVETVEPAPSHLAPALRPVPQALGTELSQVSATAPCPHLGLISDPDTRHGFASSQNRCYALNAPLEVTINQQGTFCLFGAHSRCPILTGENRSPRVPIDTAAEAAQRAKRTGSRQTGRLNKR